MTVVQRPENGRWCILSGSTGKTVMGGFDTLNEALDFTILTMCVFGGWGKSDRVIYDKA